MAKNMTDWAYLLNGRQYRSELSREEERQAFQDGMLIVFGASDDLLEFRGVFHDELGAYNGTKAEIDCKGSKPVWKHGDEKGFDEAKEFFAREGLRSFTVVAEWDVGDFSWIVSIDVANSHGDGPNCCPFLIKEDDEQYCRGLVIDFAGWCKANRQEGT